ncbi:MAG: YceD family protein [Gammaproteobacteria bacterium]|nr:YceD family protein [Gammaproteobacteria bacterium]
MLPDVLNALLAADKKQTVSRLYAPASFTRLEGLLQSTAGELSLNLDFRRDRNNRILLSGDICGKITVRCQRCLEPVSLQLDLPLELVLAERKGNGGEPIAGREAYSCDPLKLELGALVEEEILLALPLVAMHEEDNEDCRKLIDQSVAGDVQQPFADLKNLTGRG